MTYFNDFVIINQVGQHWQWPQLGNSISSFFYIIEGSLIQQKMLSVRKLTYKSKLNLGPNPKESGPKPKTSFNTFQPQTRVEKIRCSGVDYPFASGNKIVFKSNRYGNGFKSDPRANEYSGLQIEEMKQSVNKVCYQTWQLQRQHLQQQSFADQQTFIKLLALAVVACLLSFFVASLCNYYYNQNFFFAFAVICVILAIIALLKSLYVFSRSYQQADFDSLMVVEIKNRLAVLNQKEVDASDNKPRFEWTCNKDVTWIAITIFEDQSQEEIEA